MTTENAIPDATQTTSVEAAPVEVAAQNAAATEVKTVEAEAGKTSPVDNADTQPQDQTKADEAKAVPEKYEDFKLPEGMDPDPEFQATLSEWAKEANLDQEGAQKMADKAASYLQKARQAQMEAIQTQKAAWEAEVRADKEIGGEKLDANLAVAKKAMETYFPAEFKTFLEETGLGNHPAMVRGLYKIGKPLMEDSMVRGSNGTGAPQILPTEQVFWGNTNK